MIATIDRLGGAALLERQKFQTETFRTCKPAARKHRSASPPDASWSLAALTSAARHEHQRIEKGETRVTPRYWRLGTLLNLVRQKKKFRKGEWQVWLARHEIGKLRAFRARKLAKAYSLDELHTLTLQEALDRIAARQPAEAAKLGQKLARRLKNLAKTIVRTADESAQLGRDRGDLLAHADQLAEALDYLRRSCT